MLIVAVGNNFDVRNGACDGEDLEQHILSYTAAEVADVKVTLRLLGASYLIHRLIHDLSSSKY